jgi:hypothetical protein
VHAEPERESRLSDVKGESDKCELRMPSAWIRVVLQVRAMHRRERVRPRHAQLYAGRRRELPEPARSLRLRLSARIRLQSGNETVRLQPGDR